MPAMQCRFVIVIFSNSKDHDRPSDCSASAVAPPELNKAEC